MLCRGIFSSGRGRVTHWAGDVRRGRGFITLARITPSTATAVFVTICLLLSRSRLFPSPRSVGMRAVCAGAVVALRGRLALIQIQPSMNDRNDRNFPIAGLRASPLLRVACYARRLKFFPATSFLLGCLVLVLSILSL